MASNNGVATSTHERGVVMNMMNDLITRFTFQHPWVLLLSAPLILFWWWQTQHIGGEAKWHKWVDAHLLGYLLQNDQVSKRKRYWSILAVWLLASVALAGPSLKREHQSATFSHENAQVLLLDLTPSMHADDVKPSRIARAKLKALDWLKRHQEGQTALVVYSGSAHVVVPFSTDTRTLSALIPTLDTNLPPVIGNDPVQALQLIEKMRQDSQLPRVDVMWISDGFDADQTDAINQVLQQAPLRISFLAVGSEAGAPVRLSNERLLTDAKGQIVLAKVEHSRLMQWAQQRGARYSSLQTDDGDLRALTWPLLNDDEFSSAEAVSLQWQDIGGWICVALLPLALWSMRRASLFVLLLFVGLQSPRADASWWQDLWQTRDQQGAQALQDKQPAKAAELFENNAWRAVAQYRDGKFGDAEKGFAQSPTADGLFNQANALAYGQRYQEAEKAYEAALKKNPQHKAAKDNLAALREFLKKQAQQQAGQSDQSQNKDQKGTDAPQNSQTPDQQQKSSQEQQQQQQAQSSSAREQNSQAGKQSESDQKQKAQQKGEQQQDGKDKQNAQTAQAIENEQQTKQPTDPQVEALLRQLPDDPAGLLRRRMKLELLRRGQNEPEASSQDKW